MRDGEVIRHHPVGFHDQRSPGEWLMWCEDCDLSREYDSEQEMRSDWRWHFLGQLGA